MINTSFFYENYKLSAISVCQGFTSQMASLKLKPFKGSTKAKFRRFVFLEAIVERVQSFLSSMPA